MFGRDMAPYNGPGVNLIWNNSTNYPAIDQNYDGFADTIATGQPNLMQLNFSAGAQAVLVPAREPAGRFQQFCRQRQPLSRSRHEHHLSRHQQPVSGLDTLVPNGTGNPVRVITPSFHRPMLLRNAPAFGGGTVTPYTWYTDKNTAALVLFPHASIWRSTPSATFPTNSGRTVYPTVCLDPVPGQFGHWNALAAVSDSG